MRRIIVAVVAAALSLVVASPSSAQGRQLLPTVFYTPPLGNVDSLITNMFEASFVSTTSVPVVLTIQTCTLAGVCTTPPFSPCIGITLNRGQGCSTGNLGDNEPIYAKFFVHRQAGGGPVDGLGSLRVTGPGGNNSAAVQTIGSNGSEVLLTDQ